MNYATRRQQDVAHGGEATFVADDTRHDEKRTEEALRRAFGGDVE